ncbi:hypothetical protein WG66_013622 [Moniliophthora roreri]|nr:hypothetical protein WG66_013622 [Moniliophthora roreri]
MRDMSFSTFSTTYMHEVPARNALEHRRTFVHVTTMSVFDYWFRVARAQGAGKRPRSTIMRLEMSDGMPSARGRCCEKPETLRDAASYMQCRIPCMLVVIRSSSSEDCLGTSSNVRSINDNIDMELLASSFQGSGAHQEIGMMKFERTDWSSTKFCC